MTFNEEELIKIKKSTSGWFKKSARKAIVQSINNWKPLIENAKRLPQAERKAALKTLMNDATAARREALQSGASSHGDPRWAAAAVPESWIQELFVGTPDSIKRVERLIDELLNRT